MDYTMGRCHAHTMLVATPQNELAPTIAALPAQLVNSISPSSLAAYEKDLRLLGNAGLKIPCTEEEIMKFIETWRRRISPRTMYRRLAAMRFFYPTDPAHPEQYPFGEPTLQATMRGLRLGYFPLSAKSAKARLTPVAQAPDSAKPITRKTLRLIDAQFDVGIRAVRDRAIILLGFEAALRRTQITALNFADLRFDDNLLAVTIRSPRNPSGPGKTIAIPVIRDDLCTARAIQQWVQRAGLDLIESTQPVPLFTRFDRAGDPTPHRLDAAYVSVIVKDRVRAAGLDPEKYSGDSMRRGRLLELAK